MESFSTPDAIVHLRSLEKILVFGQADEAYSPWGNQLFHHCSGDDLFVVGIIVTVPFAPRTNETDGKRLDAILHFFDNGGNLIDMAQSDLLGGILTSHVVGVADIAETWLPLDAHLHLYLIKRLDGLQPLGCDTGR